MKLEETQNYLNWNEKKNLTTKIFFFSPKKQFISTFTFPLEDI